MTAKDLTELTDLELRRVADSIQLRDEQARRKRYWATFNAVLTARHSYGMSILASEHVAHETAERQHGPKPPRAS